jgi:hypothetical protein
MSDKLDSSALDRLFLTARTRNAWTDVPPKEATLRKPCNIIQRSPGRGNDRTAAIELCCRELVLYAMVTCNQRRLLCRRIPGRRATRLGCIASGCAPRDCGRYRSGYLTCERAPSSPLLANNPRQWPRANKQLRISNLLTLFRGTLPSEARRDLDGVGWCELHREAATGGHRAGGQVQSNGLNHSLRVHDRSDGSTVTAHGHRTN